MLPSAPDAARSEAAPAVRWPAEWTPHAACWLAWPSHPEEWRGDLEAPRREVAALCRAIAGVAPAPAPASSPATAPAASPVLAAEDAADGAPRGEPIDLLVLDRAGEASARAALAGVPVRFHQVPFGDIWLRDTGPIFVATPDGPRAACFAWNGWGGSYLLAHDDEVGRRIAARADVPAVRHDWILEGGAVEGDGQGTALTTRQCLQNPNRNPALDAAAIEARLRQALGVETVVWLERGLENDHTDGHVDTLARFVAPGRVVCMRAAGADPNRAALDQVARALGRARDARGRALEVVEIPAPGPVHDLDGTLMPASYVNFYIANKAVIVPVYGTPHDREAVDTIAALFPGRRAVGLDARAVLVGGGGFHCITREQPLAPPTASQETHG